jgi:hypothetical protein
MVSRLKTSKFHRMKNNGEWSEREKREKVAVKMIDRGIEKAAG